MGLDALHKSYRIGGNTLAATREAELFGGGRLHRNILHRAAHNLCQAGPHGVDVGAEFGGLKRNGNIHIANLIPPLSQVGYRAGQKYLRVDTLIGWVVVGKVGTDVARGYCSEQRIAQGVDGYIAIGVGHTAKRRVNPDTPDYQRQPLGKSVYIVSKSYAHSLYSVSMHKNRKSFCTFEAATQFLMQFFCSHHNRTFLLTKPIYKMSVLDALKPALVWEIFEEITRVPRPSKHEERIIAYLVDFAIRHNLEHKVDAAGNVVIYKPATPGYEAAPAVVLQSHSDMVCEKNADTVHDFMTDPIEAYIDGEWVKAKGTTLGADCGIGMAAALAVLVDESLKHPAIEALFTVDEETGLTGAFNLAPDMLTGKYLLNLDSEDEGELFIGCAGGVDTLATFNYKSEAAPKGYGWLRIDIGGLKGGHSGDNIPDGLGNSNKIMARLLQMGHERYGLRIADFNGGNLRNAIPREAFAVVGVPEKKRAAFLRLVKKFAAEVAGELQYTDAGFWMKAAKCLKPSRVIDRDTQWRLLTAIVSVANGVLAMSFAMKGLVETSTNLASVKFVGRGKIQVVTSQRSSVESAKRYAARTVEGTFALAGAKVVHSDGYPGWAPNPQSYLLDVAVATYRELFAKEPVVRAIHAGLECGLFLEKYPHLEMISFGPTLRGVHSPDERLEIATVDKFWRHLVRLLEELK